MIGPWSAYQQLRLMIKDDQRHRHLDSLSWRHLGLALEELIRWRLAPLSSCHASDSGACPQSHLVGGTYCHTANNFLPPKGAHKHKQSNSNANTNHFMLKGKQTLSSSLLISPKSNERQKIFFIKGIQENLATEIMMRCAVKAVPFHQFPNCCIAAM